MPIGTCTDLIKAPLDLSVHPLQAAHVWGMDICALLRPGSIHGSHQGPPWDYNTSITNFFKLNSIITFF
jgi:hypothetical protein